MRDEIVEDLVKGVLTARRIGNVSTDIVYYFGGDSKLVSRVRKGLLEAGVCDEVRPLNGKDSDSVYAIGLDYFSRYV